MSAPSGRVTADDVDAVVAVAIGALSVVAEPDWRVPARASEWDCREVVEHVADTLHYYAAQLVPTHVAAAGPVPFDFQPRRPGGPDLALATNPESGSAGLLRVLDTCAGLLASLVRTASPELRAHHMWGRSDAEGFAAMGVVEMLVHTDDVASALGIEWTPPEVACAPALHRLFPDAPTDAGPWPTLLWATGRAELPGHPRLDDNWRWYSEPR